MAIWSRVVSIRWEKLVRNAKWKRACERKMAIWPAGRTPLPAPWNDYNEDANIALADLISGTEMIGDSFMPINEDDSAA